MTVSPISFEIKSQLAKLLATENLTVRHNPNARTAYFNTQNRELVLPVWQNISEDLYDMLVVHEVGHALDTPTDAWMTAIDKIAGEHFTSPTDKNKMAVKGFLNVIEDARIDKLQKRRYPGSKRNYVNGYKELYERDFFGIAKKDVNSLTFIDRINVFFKHGACFNIQFTDEERVFIRRIEKAETFDDVISITNEVFGFSIEKRDFKKNEVSSEQDLDDIIDELDQQTTYDQDIDLNEEEDASSDMDMDGDDVITDEDDIDTDDVSDMIESSDKTEDQQTMHEELDIPETEKNAEEFMKNIVVDQNVSYIYVNTPEFQHSNIVDDYKVVMKDIYPQYLYTSKHDSKHTIRIEEFLSFKRKEMDTISFMVKEFEMKKSADAYARTTVSKTGILDTNKLHSYMYNDDIFRKMSIVPNGKNHGFFMLLDWSGSMLSDLKSTIKQLISLVLFCKRIQVPFEVYTFLSGDRYNNTKECLKDRNEAHINFHNFKMRNILSSRMDTKTLNDALVCLWFATYGYKYKNDDMDSTPLNQAILASDVLINDFRKKNKLQVVNTIVLTDGGSDPCHLSSKVFEQHSKKNEEYRFFVRDHVTRKTYEAGHNLYGHKVTEIFLKMLKERTDCNLVGFFLTRSMNQSYGLLNIDYSLRTVLSKKFKEDLFIKLDTVGYDEYYCVNVRQMTQNQDDTLNVNSNMTPKGILKQFMKFSEKKTVNRVMLTTFINRVTKAA